MTEEEQAQNRQFPITISISSRNNKTNNCRHSNKSQNSNNNRRRSKTFQKKTNKLTVKDGSHSRDVTAKHKARVTEKLTLDKEHDPLSSDDTNTKTLHEEEILSAIEIHGNI